MICIQLGDCKMELEKIKLAIVGLGYVGLPLAVEFGKICPVKGFDTNKTRIHKLKAGIDVTNELTGEDLNQASLLEFTDNISEISECNYFIVTVPTPVDNQNRPDLTPLLGASKMLGSILKKGDIVIYESTVYPGCTEDDCVPVLEQYSQLKFNEDFFCGYSPERINPGDKFRTVSTIKKITSGSTPEVAEVVDGLYSLIIKAGTHRAESIRVAEAAKVIENTQRDVNIALVNELAIIFNLLNIDTQAVLEAAGTKWNFLPFRPGLVGGHCIGIDPYYLKYKAQCLGYHPKIISAVRQLNDDMGRYVVAQFLKALIAKKIQIVGANILILGLAFKENCSDLRNSRVVDIVSELKGYKCNVDIYDPWIDPKEAVLEHGVDMVDQLKSNHYDGIILAVAHNQFKEMGFKQINELGKSNRLIYDLKYVLSKDEADIRL